MLITCSEAPWENRAYFFYIGARALLLWFRFGFSFCLNFFFFDQFHWSATTHYVAGFTAARIRNSYDKAAFITLILLAFFLCQKIHLP